MVRRVPVGAWGRCPARFALMVCLVVGLAWGSARAQTSAPSGAEAKAPLTAGTAAAPVQTPPVVTSPVLGSEIPLGETVTTAPGGVAAGPTLIPGLQMWFGTEYLMYYVSGMRVPIPLITSGTSSAFTSGAIGEPGTQIAVGDQRFNQDPYSGIRARFGIDLANTGFGIEGVGFVLGQQSTEVQVPTANFSPSVQGLPFFNVTQNAEDALLVNFPDLSQGTSTVRARTNLTGWEVNAGYACNKILVDWAFVGFRYLNLTEGLFQNTTLTSLQDGALSYLGAAQPAGSVARISDSFRTGNEFNGGQVGAVKRVIYGRVALETRWSVAFGNTRQRVSIWGESQLNEETPVRGGLFAQPSNDGDRFRNRFSVVPEVGISLYVQCWSNCLAFVGYNFLYWNNVARPGYEIDRNVDARQIPFNASYDPNVRPLRPNPLNLSTDVIVHGLNAGLAFQF